MTSPDLGAIRERRAKAPKGPYRVEPFEGDFGVFSFAVFGPDGPLTPQMARRRDADFIAHAWSDVAALLELVDAERARANKAEDDYDALRAELATERTTNSVRSDHMDWLERRVKSLEAKVVALQNAARSLLTYIPDYNPHTAAKKINELSRELWALLSPTDRAEGEER